MRQLEYTFDERMALSTIAELIVWPHPRCIGLSTLQDIRVRLVRVYAKRWRARSVPVAVCVNKISMGEYTIVELDVGSSDTSDYCSTSLKEAEITRQQPSTFSALNFFLLPGGEHPYIIVEFFMGIRARISVSAVATAQAVQCGAQQQRHTRQQPLIKCYCAAAAAAAISTYRLRPDKAHLLQLLTDFVCSAVDKLSHHLLQRTYLPILTSNDPTISCDSILEMLEHALCIRRFHLTLASSFDCHELAYTASAITAPSLT
jgi:hypothetical protein